MRTESSEVNAIDNKIVIIRGQSVILDSDLAHLYCVTTKALLQGARRNRKRFPHDFMFQLSKQEVTNLRSQIVTSSSEQGYGGRRYSPWAFTEQGVAMLSSVLRSDVAVRVNIEIMRAFVRLRRAAMASGQLMSLVEDLSKRVETHDAVISDIVESIRQLVEPPVHGRARPIGFTADLDTKD
ncbi:MAG TPA: ORF6N domain-containing protein [Steroidobacteraceae bacterium]